VAVYQVNLEDLVPGGVLAEPVYNQQGVLLLDAKSKINANHIRVFKSWGIETVSLKGRSVSGRLDGDASAQSAAQEKLTADMSRQFADVLDDPLMVEIMESALRLRLKKPGARKEK
jgi:hypothetical protein